MSYDLQFINVAAYTYNIYSTTTTPYTDRFDFFANFFLNTRLG